MDLNHRESPACVGERFTRLYSSQNCCSAKDLWRKVLLARNLRNRAPATSPRLTSGGHTMLGTILLIVLILLLLGAVPAWPYSRDWGYYPTGGLGLVLLIVIILLLLGRI